MNTTYLCRILGSAALLTWLVATPVAALEPPSWAGEPFSASPAELLQADASVPLPDDPGVVVLLRAGSYEFDAQGRAVYGYHLIYRVRSQEAVRGWSSVSRSWRPWYQDRPEVRARVIAPDGTEHRLDPATLGEYSVSESGPDLYGDTKKLSGPLPAVTVGSVVEEYHVVRDREPFFDAGYTRNFWLGGGQPVRFARLTLGAPESLPVRYEVVDLPALEVDRTEADGRVRIEFRHGPLEPATEPEPFAPGDAPSGPYIRFSTAESWNAVATRYAARVADRIAESDVSKRAKKAAKGIDDRAAVIDAMLAAVHEDVRYTGVEFGEQAIIPTDPGGTLGRGFGDCKDLSTLMVALLAERDIEAHVALLSTGPGADVDPDLPGLGPFNHAIVYVPGDPPIWIDPTDPHSRAGVLPSVDQGRLTLIADPSTTGLTPTPLAQPADNRIVERREVFLGSEGGGRIVETTEWSGSFQAMVRAAYGSKTEDQQRERLERYVEGAYQSEALASFRFTDLDDVVGSPELWLEANEARRAWTAPGRATVTVPIGSLLSDLPDPLKERWPDDGDDQAAVERPRSNDLVLPNPYVHEWHYTIHPPPGYVVAELPEAEDRPFGPARLTVAFEELESGDVTGTLVFDTGKARYTPGEVRAFREALTEFYDENQPQVHFDQLGERYLETGQVREAIDEFRALVAAYPEVALYRTQVARALLMAGLGGAARTEAKRATELDPESDIAWYTLGVVLAHDEIGRKFEPGWDPDGARDAQKRALGIDPEEANAQGELAIILEHDADGRRYTAGTDVDAAIEAYRVLRVDLDNHGLATNEMAALLHAGRFAEVETLADEVPGQGARSALRIAAIAAGRGADVAIREATQRSSGSDNYRALLAGAAEWLIQTRHYPEAGALMKAGAKGDGNAVERLALADLVSRVTRYDDDPPTPDTPEGLMAATLVATLTSDGSGAGLVALADPMLPTLGDPEQIEEYLGTDLGDLGWQFRNMGLSTDIVIDMMLASSRMVVDDDGTNGFRVRGRFTGMTGAEETLRLYGLQDGKTCRWTGYEDQNELSALHVVAWVDDGELERAGAWLEWLIEPTVASSGDDPLSGHPARRFWSRGDEPDAMRMRLAAASMMIDPLVADRGIAIVEQTCPEADGASDRDLVVSCDLARVWLAMAGKNWDRMEQAAGRLQAVDPDSEFAFMTRVDALGRLQRFDDARALVASRLERFPDDVAALSADVMVAFRAADHEGAMSRMRAMIDDGLAGPGDYNNLAWLEIVEDTVTEDTLRLAQQAAAMENYGNPSTLHTLATAYAELGRPGEARDVLLEVLSSRGKPDLEGVDLYILGRIAEDYGVPDAARSFYERVEPPDEDEPAASSTRVLADRRLQVLGSAEAKP